MCEMMVIYLDVAPRINVDMCLRWLQCQESCISYLVGTVAFGFRHAYTLLHPSIWHAKVVYT